MNQSGFIIGGGAGAAGSGNGASSGGGDIIDTTTESFGKDVLEASRDVPVLVDFWAPWCEPCKQLTPVLESVVTGANGRVKLVKMNIDDHPQIAGQLGIQSIPAVIVFKNGQPVDGFMGAQPESQIQALVDKVAGPAEATSVENTLEAAETARTEKDWNGAAQLYAAVLGEEPENVTAIAGLAQCYTATGNFEKARQTLAMVPESKSGEDAVASARAALEIAEQAAAIGDSAALEEKLSKNPDDHQARFDLALVLNAHDAHGAAVDHLIEIVRRDREWDEEAARKQLLQFFEAWGPTNPATSDGRRKLSAILFS